MSFPALFGNLIVLVGMIAAIYYLIVTHSFAKAPSTPNDITEQFLHIVRRRRFGAAIMILIAVMFFIATNWYMDVKTPGMSVFWLLLMSMLLWLLILAAMDIVAVKKLRQKVMDRNYQRFKTTLDDFKDSTEKKNDNDDTNHSSQK